ncbi:RecT family recombinase [Lacticaseibacillus paracasei]|jgi:recombination protein RecT|uniref:RecT family recombinase n=1 Tax=Lacticaseibacillus paracasei TaxID=1597 RepID=UPI00204A3F48|nr:MAG TPA: RecT protein [Caudoviricetes sp.]
MANEIINYVDGTIQEMRNQNGLALPPNYSAGNALNAAYLMLADRSKGPSYLDKMENGQITKVSVVRALQDMVIQGLSPAKNQGYFIQYGQQLDWSRSYFGAVAIVERQPEVKGKPYANVVHQDDEFEIGSDEDGRTIVTKFTPSFANQDKPIIGAFAVIDFDDGHKEYTVMTKAEIDQSWSHRRNKGQVQNEFPQEMAKRTVLNRAAKFVINTSGDNDLMIESVNRTAAQEFDNDAPKDVTPSFADLMGKESSVPDDKPKQEVNGHDDQDQRPEDKSEPEQPEETSIFDQAANE